MIEIKINGPRLNAFLSSEKNTDEIKSIVHELVRVELGLQEPTMTLLGKQETNLKAVEKGRKLLIDLNVAEQTGESEEYLQDYLKS